MGVKQVSDRVRFELWKFRDTIRDSVFGRAHRQAAFQRIYEQNLWGDSESVSGSGSRMAATEPIRRELPNLFQRLGVQSVLDAPCGDFAWMKEIAKDLNRYIGVDIVPDLIERNQAAYGNDTVSFICADMAVSRLPCADLILCRDCFIHFSTKLIRCALHNFRASDARYLLLSNDSDAEPYHNIPIGSCRRVNFLCAPFSFPPPVQTLHEYGSSGRQLCLWELKSLPLEWV